MHAQDDIFWHQALTPPIQANKAKLEYLTTASNVGKASGTGKCNDFSPVSSLGIRGIVNRFPCCCARDLHNGLLKLALHLIPTATVPESPHLQTAGCGWHQ